MYIHPARVEMIVTTKIPIGHGSTIVATYAATLHKILPPVEWYINDDLWKSVNADLSFRYCRPPCRPSSKNPSFVLRCCELPRIVREDRKIETRIISIFNVERDIVVAIRNDWIVVFFFFGCYRGDYKIESKMFVERLTRWYFESVLLIRIFFREI